MASMNTDNIYIYIIRLILIIIAINLNTDIALGSKEHLLESCIPHKYI